MKQKYDRKAHDVVINVEDEIYVKKQYVRKGESKKLNVVYHDLSRVLEVCAPIVKVQSVASGRVHWRHHNQLKLKPRKVNQETQLRVRFRTDEGRMLPRDTTVTGEDLQTNVPTAQYDCDYYNETGEATDVEFASATNSQEGNNMGDFEVYIDEPSVPDIDDSQLVPDRNADNDDLPPGEPNINDAVEQPVSPQAADEGLRRSSRTRMLRRDENFVYS